MIHAIKTNKDLAKWLDRDTVHLAKDIDLQYDLLPFVITSRSNDKLVDIRERFGLKTIREMRLEILNKALVLVDKKIDDGNETYGFTKQLTQEQTALLKTKLVHLKKTR